MSRLLRIFASVALAVSAITLLARLIGFARWLVFSPTVGAGAVGTAYQTANQVPNILFEVVAGGALAGAIVPLLAGPLARANTAEASRIASALLTWAISVTLPLTLVLAVAAQPIAAVLTANAGDGVELTAQFLLMFSPQLVLYAIGAVLTGVLQAHRKFLWPAFTPLLSSLVVIGAYLMYWALGRTGSTTEVLLAWLGWGTTAGVAALALPLALPATRTGVRLRPTWSFPPGVARRAVRLAAAGMAVLLAQQAATLTTMVLSNRIGGVGTFVLFSYIQAVYMLPYAILAVPIATVVFPKLSRQVAEAKDQVAGTVASGTATILAAGVLGAVILISAAVPLQAFFTSIDAAGGSAAVPFGAIAPAVVIMALAVPGWSMVAWATRVFYALERSRHAALPTTLGWVFVVIGMVVAALAYQAAGNAELTLLAVTTGFAVGMSVAGCGLVLAIRRVLGPAGLAGCVKRSLIVFLAGAVAALCGWWLAGLIVAVLTPAIGVTAGAVSAGIVAALVACLLLLGSLALADRKLLVELRSLTSR